MGPHELSLLEAALMTLGKIIYWVSTNIGSFLSHTAVNTLHKVYIL